MVSEDRVYSSQIDFAVQEADMNGPLVCVVDDDDAVRLSMGLLIETLGGLETLKACGAESERQHKWESTHGALARLETYSRLLAAVAMNGTLFLQQVAGMATIVAGVYSITAGNLSVGALVACYMLGSRVLAPLGQIAGLITRYQQARLTSPDAAAAQVLAWLERADFGEQVVPDVRQP